MKETTITRQIMQSWKRIQPLLWWHKIPDARFGCETGTRAVDVLACWCGTLVGLEFKLVTRGVSIAFDKIRDSQLLTLQEIELAGGVGFIIIVHYEGPRDKCAYAVPVSVWLERAIYSQRIHGRKSIRLDEFADYRFEQKHKGGQLNWETTKIQERVDVAIDRL